MIPTTTPNKAQKDWREAVRSQGCCLGYPGNVEIHHVAGRTASYEKVHIGHWFVLPASKAAHNELPTLGYDEQKRLFYEVCREFVRTYQPLPFSAETLWAIAAWRR